MDRTSIEYTDHFPQVMKVLTSGGLLLGAYDAEGKPNAMTIGWGTIGSIWSMPLWIVLVRPSRFTYECLEHTGAFTVNVPGPDLTKAVTICGTRSGRDGDKLADSGLTAEKALTVNAPTLAECPIVYECDVVARNDLIPEKLIQPLLDGPYAGGDFHRVYFGRIQATHAAVDTATRLG